MRVLGASPGLKVISSPSSSPEINRLARGRRDEEVAGVELVRTLWFIAGYAAAGGRGMHVWKTQRFRDQCGSKDKAVPGIFIAIGVYALLDADLQTP